MAAIDRAAAELAEMDDLAALESPIHELNPVTKLLVTVIYICVTASFGKYDLSGLVVMSIYPAVIFSLSEVSVKTCFYKLRIVLPIVCAVGIFNPFFDKAPLLTVGTATITGGVMSMAVLMLKGVLCLASSFLLAATTTIDEICFALRKLFIPSIFITLILLTYRYISVMIEEVSIMSTAYKLRAPGQKGIHYSAWGSFLGQLLLRSMDRAEEIYSSMQLRGIDGNFRYAAVGEMDILNVICLIAAAMFFALCRTVNIAGIIGNAVAGGLA